MELSLLEKLTMALRAYCQASNPVSASYEVTVEPHGSEVRAVIVADHFTGMVGRQSHLWPFLRANMDVKDLALVGCIQTLAPGEERFGWPED